MKPMTREWVAKAEGDFATAQREARVRKNPNHNAQNNTFGYIDLDLTQEMPDTITSLRAPNNKSAFRII